MQLILGLFSNIYVSYLLCFTHNHNGTKLNNSLISKNFEMENYSPVSNNVKFKSPFETLSRISILIIFTSLFWTIETYNNLPSINNGIEIILFDGLCKISPLILISEIYLMVLVLIMLQLIGNNNKTKQTGPPELFLLIIANLIGLTYLINSNEWVVTITAWELMNLSLYLLVTMKGGRSNKVTISAADTALAAGIKYFLLSALTTAYMLMGISLIYGKTGSTNYDVLISFWNVLDNLSNIYDSSIVNYEISSSLTIGLLLISITIMFKLGAAPFHSWAPDLYDAQPTPITMYISIIPKIAILIFLLVIFPMIYHLLVPIFISIIAIISIIVGSIGLGTQWRIKRFITYSAISHLGLILLAYISLCLDSYLYYIFIYGITNLIFFSILLVISSSLDSEKQLIISLNNNSNSINNKIPTIDDGDISYIISGIFKMNPFLAFVFSITLFSLAGIPPLAGFFAKLQVIQGLIYDAHIIIAIIVILTSAISTANYLSVIQRSAFDIPKMSNYTFITVKPFNSYIISILTSFIILFFLKPSILLSMYTILII